MPEIHVAFAVDETFLTYCSAALTSICRHLPGPEEIRFYLLHNGSISETARCEFFEKTPCLAGKYARAEFVEMKDRLDISKQVVTSAHITAETYFRLYLHEIFPELNKILYLDADVVVMRNIKELFDIDISNLCLAGVEDLMSHEFMKRLDLPLTEKYVNGGVLLMNLDNIREINASARVEEILNSPLSQAVTFGDQDLTALIFKGRIKYIPLRWNILARPAKEMAERCGIVNGIDLEDMLAARSNPYILHYAGPQKPWDGASSKEYTCLGQFLRWFKYASETGYFTAEFKKIESANRRKLKVNLIIGQLKLLLDKILLKLKFKDRPRKQGRPRWLNQKG